MCDTYNHDACIPVDQPKDFDGPVCSNCCMERVEICSICSKDYDNNGDYSWRCNDCGEYFHEWCSERFGEASCKNCYCLTRPDCQICKDTVVYDDDEMECQECDKTLHVLCATNRRCVECNNTDFPACGNCKADVLPEDGVQCNDCETYVHDHCVMCKTCRAQRKTIIDNTTAIACIPLDEVLLDAYMIGSMTLTKCMRNMDLVHHGIPSRKLANSTFSLDEIYKACHVTRDVKLLERYFRDENDHFFCYSKDSDFKLLRHFMYLRSKIKELGSVVSKTVLIKALLPSQTVTSQLQIIHRMSQ